MDFALGSVFNDIYRVERFIARGGMGDVYAGVNIETDEEVAIKVVLPHFAADPKVLALFRSEARLLRRVVHPAVVPYRVFARDPALGLHYIVTDLVHGDVLSERLDGNPARLSDAVSLLRRLAVGLRAMHAEGAVHRDMAPDNVLLPDGRIEEAKIVDFGIAKILDIGEATVVIEGFSGKLGYVAPEQLGISGWTIGPWTDVYSAALVTLAYARGRAIDMGRNFADAVDRRQRIPSLDGIAPALAPLFHDMLQPDPALRIRSMDDVLARLGDGVPATSSPAAGARYLAGSKTTEGHTSSGWFARIATVAAVIALGLLTPPSALRPVEGLRPDSPKRAALPLTAVMPMTAPASMAAPALQTSFSYPVLSVDAGAISPSVRLAGCRSDDVARVSATVGPVPPGRDAALFLLNADGDLGELLGSIGQLPLLAARQPQDYVLLEGGAYRVSACLHHAGDAAFILLDGHGPLTIPKFDAASMAMMMVQLQSIAQQKGWNLLNAVVRIAPLPTADMLSPNKDMRPFTPSRRADPYTRQVQTGAVAPQPSPAPSPPIDQSATALCRRFIAGRWKKVGTMRAKSCLARGFGSRSVQYVQFGTHTLSRHADGIGVLDSGTWRPVGNLKR